MASRKDARDAVVAARKAFPGWSAATAYNRGQVLYRVAELLEGRRGQFVDEVGAGEGLTKAKAEAAVDAAIDRWVWYAGWSDKVMQVHGSANPVAGPYFDFSVPEPTGVVAVLAPQESSLLGLVSVVAPAVVTGQHRRGPRQRAAPAARRHALGGAGNLRRARRCRERAHRPHGGGRSVAGLAHGRQRDRPRRRRPRARHRSCRSPPPTTSSGSCAPATKRRLGRDARARSGCSPTSRPRRSGTRSGSERVPIASRG